MQKDDEDGERWRGPGHASPYALSRLSGPVELVDVAREIQQADAMVQATVGGQLQVIAEQIRALQARARTLMEKARRDLELHRAACGFQRRPGQRYHLYRREDGTEYLSLLSPEEWGEPPHRFVGSYRLEADQSWTELTAGGSPGSR